MSGKQEEAQYDKDGLMIVGRKSKQTISSFLGTALGATALDVAVIIINCYGYFVGRVLIVPALALTVLSVFFGIRYFKTPKYLLKSDGEKLYTPNRWFYLVGIENLQYGYQVASANSDDPYETWGGVVFEYGFEKIQIGKMADPERVAARLQKLIDEAHARFDKVAEKGQKQEEDKV